MQLETMAPDPSWRTSAHEPAVETLASLDDRYVFHVWCDDGCPDCRARLPAFGAALEAAGIPEDRIVHYAVERLPDGNKRGPMVEEYGIDRIPTVVVERAGVEVARFVEEASLPIAEYLAERLREVELTD